MPSGFVFHSHSPEAQSIATLFQYFLVVAAVVFLTVAGLVTYGIVRFRARPDGTDPRPHFGSRRLEITWTAIPLVIVAATFILAMRTMAFVDAPTAPSQPPDLTVTGRQWWWEARYANGAVAVNEIHIPAGRRLLARIDSADVIHDFWVPELARKMDAVPGRASYLWLEADSPGTYQGTCSEFCGMQHAWMRFTVVAQSAPEFSAWLERQAQTPPEPTDGIGAEGAQLFRQHKCDECHAIRADDRQFRKGPPLTHAAAGGLLGRELPNTPQNLALWITNPQSIKPGNRMPDQNLPASDVQALTAYLESRK